MAFDTAQAEHEGIAAAIEKGDAEEAERLLSAHVRWLRQGNIVEALDTARQRRAEDAQAL